MHDFFKGKKVLVTGAGGFIASHLVETLVRYGASVRAFVRYNSRLDPGLLNQLPEDIFAEVDVISGDLRDLSAVQSAVNGMQYVFHLGALVSIPYSYLHPAEVVESNMIGTLNVLLASREAGVDRLVHTSTSEVYGTALQVPINENHPLQGQSPYSASKIGADKLAESFYCSYGLPVVTIRPFNTFGPRQSARAVIPTIITQALTQTTIKLGNLETTRDFTYVDDTVAGFIKGAGAENVEGQTFNLGTGEEIKIGDLAHMIIDKVPNEVTIEIDKIRLRPQKSEVYRLLSDNTLAAKAIDWKPEVTFEQGIEKTIDWISQHLDLYHVSKYEI